MSTLARIDELLRQASADLGSVKNSADLEAFRAKYLGPKGALKDLMTALKDVPAEIKPAFGKAANELRQKLQTGFDELKANLGSASGGGPSAAPKGPALDLTEPGLPPRLGRQHVLTQTIDDLVDVFGRMGFDVATGPEVEDESHNFVALNIPEAHPARDPLDNFYIDTTPGSAHLLRSQTSTIQIRVMEKAKPPVRVVAMGRVYRPDEHDATHYSMFHQVEGLYVDRGVSMSDLKTTLIQFIHAYFGPDCKIRLRPSFFPFTEPSAEMDVWMQIRGVWKWVEIGGCGMVDPNVFKAVGYDPEIWTGFAFGLGIERLAMRKYGITDIRWLFENDVRFLRQF
ncbi:MAG: phenylalanine--tRNA ligase subunit alpha [Planctomycetota bacterium]|nr:phenylalanine--tRNA ligase subunit alpha [Planctomycetota bacterium]